MAKPASKVRTLPKKQKPSVPTVAKKSLLDLADMFDPPEKKQETYAEWLKENLAHLFPIKFGPHHLWLLNNLQKSPHGSRLFLAASRGIGKTTVTLLGLPLACIALGTHQFIVIVAGTQTEAEARLRVIRAELERNQELAKQYPRLRYVMRKGSRRERMNKDEEIQLVGGRIAALGAGARIRGLVRENDQGQIIRPDLVLFDDLEDSEQARSRIRTDRLEEWLFADVVNLGGPTAPKDLTVCGIGTTISSGALATRAVRRAGRFATWQTKVVPAETKNEKGERIASWPEGMPIEYLDRLLDPDDEKYIGNFTFSREFLLDPQDIVGALWTEKHLKLCRPEDPTMLPNLESLRKIVVAVDPTYGKKGDECGIIVAGLGQDEKVYILADLSQQASPAQWGAIVADAYRTWQADNIVAEINFGAAIVEQTLKLTDPTLTFKPLHASRGKEQRAEPVLNLYEQGRVIHTRIFPLLENQMISWIPGTANMSPDRVDSLVWACHYLALVAAGPTETWRPRYRLPHIGPRTPLAAVRGSTNAGNRAGPFAKPRGLRVIGG